MSVFWGSRRPHSLRTEAETNTEDDGEEKSAKMVTRRRVTVNPMFMIRKRQTKVSVGKEIAVLQLVLVFSKTKTKFNGNF